MLATSLGGPETLVTHPASTTHVNLTPEELEATGIGPGSIRVSVGLEHPDDIDRRLRCRRSLRLTLLRLADCAASIPSDVPELIEVELYRQLAEGALDRTIAEVDAPDAWYLKRGTTAEALRRRARRAVVRRRPAGSASACCSTSSTTAATRPACSASASG